MSVKSGYVYLMLADGTNPPRYKIGLTTRHPEDRLKEINGKQSPYPIKLITYVFSNDCHLVEKYLHKKYKKYNTHNEYFEFPPEVFKQVLGDYNYRSEFLFCEKPRLSVGAIIDNNQIRKVAKNNSTQVSTTINLTKKQYKDYETKGKYGSNILNAFALPTFLACIIVSGMLMYTHRNLSQVCNQITCEVKK